MSERSASMGPAPSGIPAHVTTAGQGGGLLRGLAGELRPWRGRIVRVAVVYVVLIVVARVLALVPAAPLVLAVMVAVSGIAWYAVDHSAPQRDTVWPLTDGELGSGTRGNDFRATNLAARLERADREREGRETIVRDLHVQLSDVIRERLHAKHGIVLEDEPRWAQAVMPTELWEFLVTLPPPDLYRPARLDEVLRRIEQW